MARVKGHTLYKSIANDYKDIVDSPRGVDDAAARGGRRAKHHHIFERHEAKQHKNPAKFGLADIRDFLDFISSTPKSIPCTPTKKQITKVIKCTKNTKAKKKPKTHKFWRKFSKGTRNKNKKKTDKTLKRIKDAKHCTHSPRPESAGVQTRDDNYENLMQVYSTGRRGVDVDRSQLKRRKKGVAAGETISDAIDTSKTYGDGDNKSGGKEKKEESLLDLPQTKYTDFSSKHLEDLNSSFDSVKKQKTKPLTTKSPATPAPAAPAGRGLHKMSQLKSSTEFDAGTIMPWKHYGSHSKSKPIGLTETAIKNIDRNQKSFRDPTTNLRVHFKMLPEDYNASRNAHLNEDVSNNKDVDYATYHDADESLLNAAPVVDDEFYYEPIIELKRKRTLRKNREEKFNNQITPFKTTSDDRSQEDVTTVSSFLNNVNTEYLMDYGRIQKNVPEAVYSYISNTYTYNVATMDPYSRGVEADAPITNAAAGGRGARTEATFTAKNVAAFEIVVDLLDNTIDSAQDNAPSINSEPIKFDSLCLRPNPSSDSGFNPSFDSKLNSIQVQIALPSYKNVKKRSLSAARKVFSAVMSAPVDVRYQIHAFEDTATSAASAGALSPGVYLLVDTNMTMPKGNFILKPIGGDTSHVTLPNFKEPSGTPRMVDKQNAGEGKESIVINKNILASLLDIYNSANKSAKNRRKRDASDDGFDDLKRNGSKCSAGVLSRLASVSRRSWEAAKRHLGHDRVCRCRCRANRTMCRACAASDAVIAELIFEFDNLARYMSDHCTEIQTYFWMNPGGGRRLKDAVHRLDGTLNDYYKRVKGKCRGQTCKAFINKREIKPSDTLVELSESALPDNIDCLGEVSKRAAMLSGFDDGLFVRARECLDAITKCVTKN